MQFAGNITVRRVAAITLCAFMLMLPRQVFATMNTSQDAADQIGRLDRVTLGELFPSALVDATSKHPASNALEPAELRAFDAAFVLHIRALEKIGFLQKLYSDKDSLHQSLPCWPKSNHPLNVKLCLAHPN